MNGSDAAAETITGYGFRRAYEADAFDQFPLITPSKLRSEARDRGIECSLSAFLEELERLDREGAFRPVLFEVVDAEGAEAVVFRDEQDYVPWTEYSVPEWGRAVPQPRYSPWQLLYLNDAVELPKIPVSIEWLLDDEQRATLGPNWRTVLSRQLERWRNLDRSWRDVLLVLIRLQGWYGPSVKGTLLKSTVTLVPHPETGEYVDPRDLGPPFDPHRVLAELGLSLEALKQMHQRLAVHGMMMDGGGDPLRFWYILFRMAPAKQRAKLRGRARRAQDAYDAAEMLRRFYFDLTGELLPHADEIFDISDKSWRKRLFGRWPTLRYTRADLAVELRRRDLHPHQVHIVVEGKTEKIVCERVLEALAGMPLEDTGVSVQRLFGVGNATLQQETLQALKAFPRYLILIADNEGDMKREVERLQEQGVLTDETTFLWDTSFEEENFTDEELVAMIAAIGADRGATLMLDAATLRTLYEAHRVSAGDQVKGLATFALNLAGRPDHGSVVASKTELAERMADLILEDLRQYDAEDVSSRRPIASILISVFRVT